MKLGKIFKMLIVLVVIAGFTTSIAYAQAGRGKGRLKGVVFFGNKGTEPAVGVKVMMEFEEGGGKNIKHEKKTNKKGEFLFAHLGHGWWKIIVSAPGYMSDKKRLKVMEHSKNPKLTFRLEKAVAQVSSEASSIDKGNNLYAGGKYEEALAAFKEFQAKTPDFKQIHINIANCLQKMEKYDEAIAEYEKYLAIEEQEPKIELKAKCLASIGEIYMKRNDMDKAQEFFMKSIELNPKDEVLAFNVAEIFFGNQKNEEAVKYYKLASEIKPNWADPFLKLGYVYLNLGDMAKAKENFNTFIEKAPEDHPEAPAIKDLVKSL